MDNINQENNENNIKDLDDILQYINTYNYMGDYMFIFTYMY